MAFAVQLPRLVGASESARVEIDASQGTDAVRVRLVGYDGSSAALSCRGDAMSRSTIEALRLVAASLTAPEPPTR